MKKRLYRALIALTMTTILFCISACGAGKADTTSEETFPETEEESVEENEEAEEVVTEPESEVETEATVTDGEYAIYPAFIKIFEINDNILKVETGDAFEDYEIPTEMAINFEYPLSDEVVWSDTVVKITDEEGFDWYEWFSFYLEGITMSAERYNDGQYGDYYTSGEDFCKKNAIWTFVIKDETVQNISMDLVKDEVEETTAETKVKETESVTPGAKEDAPTPASTHTHNWKEIYGTVEHPSMGEMRQVQVGTSGEVVVCNYCGAEFSSADEFDQHSRSYIPTEHGLATWTYRAGSSIYENQWVVTQEAWTETVVTGYQCSICGATK